MNVEQSKFHAYVRFVEHKHKDLDAISEASDLFICNLKSNGIQDKDITAEKRRLKLLYQQYALLKGPEKEKFILNLN